LGFYCLTPRNEFKSVLRIGIASNVKTIVLISLLLVLLCLSVDAWAADAGSLQREVSAAGKTIPKDIAVNEAKRTDVVDDSPKVFVNSYDILGASLIPVSEIQIYIQPFAGRDLSLSELAAVKAEIAALYRSRGYLARAVLPQQIIKEGVVKVIIFEARLGKITLEEVDKNIRFPRERIRELVERGQKKGNPIRILDLENNISDLDGESGVAAQAELIAGEREGETDIVIKASSEPLINGSARLDNHGSRASGTVRAITNLNMESPFKKGERFSFFAIGAEGLRSLGGDITIPAGRPGTTVGLSGSILNYELGKPVSSLQADGEAKTLAANIKGPIYRGLKSGINLRLDISKNLYINRTVFGESSNKYIDNVSANLSFDYRDEVGGGGINVVNLTPAYGILDLSGNSEDLAQDQAGPRRDGQFAKLGFEFGRVQRITELNRIKIAIAGQKAFKNLDSAQKFSMGGPQGIRGYPNGEASGDTAVVVQTEAQHSFSDKVRGSAFYDWGWVKIDHNTFSEDGKSSANTPNSYSLHGLGVGLSYIPFDWAELKADFSVGLGKNPGEDANGDNSDGTSKTYRFWLQLISRF
jgi:hemolysin activation/secretion protein